MSAYSGPDDQVLMSAYTGPDDQDHLGLSMLTSKLYTSEYADIKTFITYI